MSVRVGHGYDVHRFEAGDAVVLGGVRIEHHRGLAALLGAIAAGDIGRHFPDSDSANANIDSRILLRKVMQLVADKGYVLSNLDSTLIAQTPQMSPHIEQMRSNLAADLLLQVGQVNVKATTTEKLGFAGREEGIAAHAVVLLETNSA
jgi:2-C-methyl-D-erythritol 2,4-cyclodiphosphate synthase